MLRRTTGACGLECGNILTAIEGCPVQQPALESCLCPVILPSGEGCSECLETYSFPAEASTIGAFYTECVDFQCQPVCNNVLSAFGSCSTLSGAAARDSCLCPAVLTSAAACSSCYLNVPALSTGAAAFGALLSACQNVETSGAAATTTPALTSSPTSTAAVNTAQTSTTANLPPATTTSKSGANGMRAERFSSMVLNTILFLAFALGFMIAIV